MGEGSCQEVGRYTWLGDLTAYAYPNHLSALVGYLIQEVE